MRKITKCIEVELPETADIEITLSYEDIINFIEKLDDNEADEICRSLNRSDVKGIEVLTLHDVLKIELITEAFKKYSLTELEEKLK